MAKQSTLPSKKPKLSFAPLPPAWEKAISTLPGYQGPMTEERWQAGTKAWKERRKKELLKKAKRRQARAERTLIKKIVAVAVEVFSGAECIHNVNHLALVDYVAEHFEDYAAKSGPGFQLEL